MGSGVKEKPFYIEIECEHGWTDDLGFPCCDLGSGHSIEQGGYCDKKDCPIYEKGDDE
jgi:hypothetical protein